MIGLRFSIQSIARACGRYSSGRVFSSQNEVIYSNYRPSIPRSVHNVHLRNPGITTVRHFQSKCSAMSMTVSVHGGRIILPPPWSVLRLRTATCVLPQQAPGSVRYMTSGLTNDMLRKEMDKLTDSFMEAKELLDDARESMGSVYFNEDLQDADTAVEETLNAYKSLLSSLSDEQKQNVIRSIGLRMEELKAQQVMIRESLKD